MADDFGDNAWLLRECLYGLVPLFQADMEGLPRDELVAIARRAGWVFAGGADAAADAMVAGGASSGAGEALTALATAIAAMTLLHPKGFCFLGERWVHDPFNPAGRVADPSVWPAGPGLEEFSRGLLPMEKEE